MRFNIAVLAILALAGCTDAVVEEEVAPPPAPPIDAAPIIEEVVEDAPKEMPLPDPEALKGKNPADIVTLLGEPGLIRWEGNVQVFQYAYKNCVLDLVFIEQSDGFHMTYYESRSRESAQTLPTPPCLAALIKVRDGTR